MKLTTKLIDMPLKHVFRTAVVERHTQLTLVIMLEEGRHVGYGECTENAFYGAKLRDLVTHIKERSAMLETALKIFQHPDDFYDEVLAKSGLHLFAQCALDTAFHDLRARQKHEKLFKSLGMKASNPMLPISSYTIGLDTPKRMIAKIKECPWPIYKIKLGTEPSQDLALIRSLREHTDAIFRVDVNGAWGLKESIEKSHSLAELGVEFIEQPLSAHATRADEEALYQASPLPLIADERCSTLDELSSCKGRFHGINVKLTKCGGITPAKRLLDAARKAEFSCMAGCMVESSIGISALAHLLPFLDYVDMDGALLLAEDPARGVRVTSAGTHYSSSSGTGALLKS